MIFGLLVLSVQPNRKVTVTFLGYTQDQGGFRRTQYRVPHNGPDSMAAFRIEVRGEGTYGYVVRALELKQPNGWVSDTNVTSALGVGLLSSDPMFPMSSDSWVPVFSNQIVLLPRPLTKSAWRCRLECVELSRRTNGWKATARDWLTQVGLINPTNFAQFEVVSEEIGR